MSSESERRAANNDLMDPDWRPDFTPRPSVGQDIDRLIWAAKSFADIPVNFEVKDRDMIKLTISWRSLRELKEAVKLLTASANPPAHDE